eukprot:m.145920 g.145920  ORF g.145920 m.145920 type:complete len:52 (+) comp52696_c0_seq7:238-393(+)
MYCFSSIFKVPDHVPLPSDLPQSVDQQAISQQQALVEQMRDKIVNVGGTSP